MCYTYDSLNRVIKRTIKNFSNVVLSEEAFSYDAAGNVTDAPDSCFAYDSNNKLTAFKGSAVSYDMDGNMLNNGKLTFSYDSANRLTYAGGHSYTYNAEDVRIRNLCMDEDTTYTYDTNCKLSRLLMKTTGGVVTKYVYGKGLIGEEVSNTFKTYHFDCRGSTIAITDESGTVTDRFTYDTMHTRRKDVMIILGDAGFNYYDDKRDDELKKEVSMLNITLFCIHGNKENRPQNVGTYGVRSFCGGKVYYEPKYPNIYFAIDGEIYTFEGKKYIVVGGAHSVDKFRCLENGTPFWYDEMPDDTVKKRVESRLKKENNKIYGIMTHTCPIDYLPTEMFMSTRQNANIKRKPRRAKPKNLFKPDIDRSTEIWLGELEKKLEYEIWFCGHYHCDKRIDKIEMLCHDIRPLHFSIR